jgi:hypothetical protein
MPAWFDEAFRRIKQLVADIRANEKFYLSPCRYRPHLDTALAQNLRKYHFSQYEDLEKFAEIYWLFSREAVANGNLLEELKLAT